MTAVRTVLGFLLICFLRGFAVTAVMAVLRIPGSPAVVTLFVAAALFYVGRQLQKRRSARLTNNLSQRPRNF